MPGPGGEPRGWARRPFGGEAGGPAAEAWTVGNRGDWEKQRATGACLPGERAFAGECRPRAFFSRASGRAVRPSMFSPTPRLPTRARPPSAVSPQPRGGPPWPAASAHKGEKGWDKCKDFGSSTDRSGRRSCGGD